LGDYKQATILEKDSVASLYEGESYHAFSYARETDLKRGNLTTKSFCRKDMFRIPAGEYPGTERFGILWGIEWSGPLGWQLGGVKERKSFCPRRGGSPLISNN